MPNPDTGDLSALVIEFADPPAGASPAGRTSPSANVPLRDGIAVVVKHECPTCQLVVPVLQEIDRRGGALTVYVQDDLEFPGGLAIIDDRELEVSYRMSIETTPTLLRVANGREEARVAGWARDQWEALTGLSGLGEGLPAHRPGCGSKSVEPGTAERLAVRYGSLGLASRRITVPELGDEIELGYELGWSDGLPVVPPSEERVYRMLMASRRPPDEVLGLIPPSMVPCTVEKVAINAVLAGCMPSYFPVVIATVRAALDPAFSLHGLLATTWFSGPMVVVNGPVRQAIGMNWQGSVLGPGNRANATIGRALQLVVRNVGGGRPRETDLATFGTPAKYTFCFAEDEDTGWTTLAEDRGYRRDQSVVTLFSADGPLGCIDEWSREPGGLVTSLAGTLRAVNNVALVDRSDVVIVVGPEHGRVFEQAGWTKADVVHALHDSLVTSVTDDGVRGVRPASHRDDQGRVLKYRPGGITVVRAGAGAGLFSTVIPGWLMTGELGTEPTSMEVLW